MYRIMIVDDEPSILNSLTRVLKKMDDWEVETYDSATDALKRAQTTNFELFISDYRMPEMDGVDFLNAIRKLQPEAMRIILSGFTDLEAFLGAINEAEIFRYICKPWDNRELVTTIKHALIHRDVLVENRRLADQVREQQQELNKRKTALELLAEKHPKLVEVEWGPDGAIIVDEE
jgi:DNA-binding NtrC family response regulator